MCSRSVHPNQNSSTGTDTHTHRHTGTASPNSPNTAGGSVNLGSAERAAPPGGGGTVTVGGGGAGAVPGITARGRRRAQQRERGGRGRHCSDLLSSFREDSQS